MCPLRVRVRSKRDRMNTASCVHESADVVRQMVLAFRPERGIKGALSNIADQSGVSFWKVRKLWNPNLQKYGFALEADEHRSLKAAWFAHLDEQEAHIRARLEHIRELREQRMGRGESQHEIVV